MTIENAKITSATIDDDRGILSVWLHLDYGHSQQGFGGNVLGRTDFNSDSETIQQRVRDSERANFMGVWIAHLFRVAEVTEFSKLAGKIIRVESENGYVIKIGHPLKDIWFDPKKEMQRLINEYVRDDNELYLS